ncbi:hypothetical protein GDO78_022044 [Eleutherodactylus coqui]|uniref:HSac2 domain-containing protein n=1 Tax=Eleutherodactylus coqui TaxID=57060 RepID=A0A8J6EGG1_ELECQ|nr:hypothetical protein GDO78_022044 [Eleutherodactylus coqui]
MNFDMSVYITLAISLSSSFQEQLSPTNRNLFHQLHNIFHGFMHLLVTYHHVGQYKIVALCSSPLCDPLLSLLSCRMSHWGTEREVIAFLCSRSLLICYYDFVELGRSHMFRVPLNYIDMVIHGPLSYPGIALNKREGNAIQIKWDKLREPPSLLSWWNPWTEDLSYINLIQHPGNPTEQNLRDMCQMEGFMEQLVKMVKLAHQRNPLPGRANGLLVLQRPVAIDTTLGLVSLFNHKVQLGYAKPRWGFGF